MHLHSLPKALRILTCLLVGLSLACATAPQTGSAERSHLFVHGQAVPPRALAANPENFVVPADTAVLHYYGAGGWGIRWGSTYVLAAPYFSNHSLVTLLASAAIPMTPNNAAVRAGFAGTPVEQTTAVLIGHGHIDHAGDVPAFFGPRLISGKPTLIADRSTTQLLAGVSGQFSCIVPIDYQENTAAARQCPLDRVRVTPIHHAHAPHLKLVGLDVAAYGGRHKEPLRHQPTHADDYKLGNTWAFLIDLLDDNGAVVFRIHYVDAAAAPPHGIASKELLGERDVDVHIGCVPGFEQTDDYPGELLDKHRVRYVLAAHWEDFFQPRTEPLMPLRQVLDASAIDRFLNLVEEKLPRNQGVKPLNKDDAHCTPQQPCGPRGAAWALPVPGETFQFRVSPKDSPSQDQAARRD